MRTTNIPKWRKINKTEEKVASKIEIHCHSLTAEGDINEVLLKTLAEAHANTNVKLEVVNEMFRKPQVRLVAQSLQFFNILYFLLIFVGYCPAALLQELEQGGFMVGLC